MNAACFLWTLNLLSAATSFDKQAYLSFQFRWREKLIPLTLFWEISSTGSSERALAWDSSKCCCLVTSANQLAELLLSSGSTQFVSKSPEVNCTCTFCFHYRFFLISSKRLINRCTILKLCAAMPISIWPAALISDNWQETKLHGTQ